MTGRKFVRFTLTFTTHFSSKRIESSQGGANVHFGSYEQTSENTIFFKLQPTYEVF